MAVMWCVVLVFAASLCDQASLAQDLGEETCLLQTSLAGNLRPHTRKIPRLHHQELHFEQLSEFQYTYQWTRKETSARTFNIKGVRPNRVGKYPVYVYLYGTFDTFASPPDLEFVHEMARKGFVSAAIEYPNGHLCPNICQEDGHVCPSHFGKTPLIEKARNVKNAFDVLCAADYSDCSKGLAVTGFSQGGFIAMMLPLLEPRISALMLMSIGRLDEQRIDGCRTLGGVCEGWMNKSWKQNEKCILDATLSMHMPRSRRRIVDGAFDVLVLDGKDTMFEDHHALLQDFSGYQCNASTVPVNCIQPDGSGYYIVAKTQYTEEDKKLEHVVPLELVVNGTGDHPWMRTYTKQDMAGHYFFVDTAPVTGQSEILPTFRDSEQPWTMKPNLNWLAKVARTPFNQTIADPTANIVEDDEMSLLQTTPRADLSRYNTRKSDSSMVARLSMFQKTYQWNWSDGSNRTFKIEGFRPNSVGKFPVYVYLYGTYDTFATPQDLEFVRHMAARGFVAAAVEYENSRFCPSVCQDGGGCQPSDRFGNTTLFEKARKIKNAFEIICSSDYADCSKGLALTGHSQGGFISLILSLLDTRVSSLMVMGVGRLSEREWPAKKWKQNEECILDSSISKRLPRSKRRYIDGEMDDIAGKHNTLLQEFSGYSCSAGVAPVNCIQADGSGYYIVAQKQYTEADKRLEHIAPIQMEDYGGVPTIMARKVAGHNFFGSTDPVIPESVLLPSFRDGVQPWCMMPNLNWLALAAESIGSQIVADPMKIRSLPEDVLHYSASAS